MIVDLLYINKNYFVYLSSASFIQLIYLLQFVKLIVDYILIINKNNSYLNVKIEHITFK